ncbi:MAG: hypothetical protein J6S63_09020 [Atopobiaceae bacterium]|nr:hypothetical protein [Atopobiaceae bacterium]
MKHFESPSAKALPKRYALDSKALAVCAAMLAIALLSATVLSGFFSSANTYTGAFKILDDKRNTVLALTAASATASAALTLIPDDTCTPIAERLSEISRDFTYVVAALLLEKYLLTTIGFAFFTIIVPLCCAIFATSRFMSPLSLTRQTLGQAAFKLFAFGLVLFISTPASVFITSQIDSTYKDSIDSTVQTAREVTEAIQDSAETSERKDPENPLEFLQQRLEDLQVGVESISQSAAGALEWVKGLLGSFVEAFAVMLVTSIVIPVLVPVVIYLAFKLLNGQQPIVVQQTAPRHLPPAE